MQTECVQYMDTPCNAAFFIYFWRFLIRSLQNIFSQSFTTKCRFRFSVVRQNSMFCRLRSKDSIFFAIIQVKISLLSAFFCFISGLDALRLEILALCHIIYAQLCHEMSYQMSEKKLFQSIHAENSDVVSRMSRHKLIARHALRQCSGQRHTAGCPRSSIP